MINRANIYDVAVIGGGLGGLTLAIQCANAGYKTILFEKEAYPYHKVCGEYISMESFPFLQQLGLDLAAFNLPTISLLQLSDVNGNLYQFDLPLGGFGISRYNLDHRLSILAIEKGVQVLQSTKVNDVSFEHDVFSIQTNNAIYSAKTVVGAFGKRANLDVKWKRNFTTQKPDKINNWVGVKYHIRYPFPKENIALHNFQNGYCGISNIEENQCCLCYLTRAENLKANENSIEKMEQHILQKNPLLKEIFSTAAFLYAEPLSISQVNFSQKSRVENHIIMIGDAAGLITPLCGNGMSMAMHAGKLAFQNINLFLQNKISRLQMESKYQQQWKKQFSTRLFIGRIVQKMFGSNTTTSMFLAVMNKMPWLAKQVIKSTHGKTF